MLLLEKKCCQRCF